MEIENVGDVLVAELHGEIDLKVSDMLREALDRALERLPVRHLVFDFGAVTFIDSTGLGVVLGRYKKVAGAGGKLGVTGLRPSVRRVLELSGILRIAREYNSRAEAVRALGGGAADA
ncbi:MAG: anti-sigma factor antagonist [Bacillota bacterium]